MHKGVSIAVSALLLFGVGSAVASKFDSVVTIRNDSDWEIHQLYVSSTDENEWGDDQLGDEIIDSHGGRFQLHGIPCDSYDVQLIDEDGDVCVVSEVLLCADRDMWRINNDDLLTCQVLTD
jgi:hypothetical protein